MAETQALARRWYESVLNDRQTNLIDALFLPEALFLTALGERKQGPAGAWSYCGFLASAIGDAHYNITHTVTDGPTVHLDITMTGTHTGHLHGLEATGSEIRLPIYSRVKTRDGKIESIHESGDLFALLSRLAGEQRQQHVTTTDQRLFPILRSLDWDQSRAFYKRAGFEVQFEWRHEPGFPAYAGIFGHGVTLHVSEHTGDCQPGGAVSIRVDDVDATHQQLTSRGWAVDEPADMPWGDRRFTIRDPDGNALTFFTMRQGEV